MKIFQRASIRHKQMLIIMAITSVALLLACAGFTAFEIFTFRAAMVKNLSVLAEIVGADTGAALDFKDVASAQESLALLQAEPHIVGAGLYTMDGRIFASYDRPNDGQVFLPPPFARCSSAEEFRHGNLALLRPVLTKGETVGVVYLVSDMRALWARLEEYVIIVTLVLLATWVVALLLSRQWQRFISEPILSLAEVARTVARDENYAVRAPACNPDEIGVLIDGFNVMLAKIQERDATLERRVWERTRQLECEVAERKHAEAELSRERDLLRSLMDNATDLIFFKDAKLRYIDWSKSLEKVIGLPASQIMGRTDHDLFEKSCADQYAADDRELFRTGQPVLGKIERNVTRQGQASWLLTSKIPLRDKNNVVVGACGICKDITAIKAAEANLDKAHRELVDTSRKAGMAEVATSVLHNVGNVLNSINVSTTLVFNAIKQSKVRNVGRLAALLREHQSDLGDFITVDPRGRQAPAFLNELAVCLEKEQAGWVKEIELTHKNIEHIKDIVAMQQSYAQVSGMAEVVRPGDLMEDALRMAGPGLARHNIEVAREFAAVPAINADKHKILQILVNLIHNAKLACDDSGRLDKKVKLELRNGGGSVRFVVADNGVGIPAENMTRIFNHGFTTRQKGHGFGLHSGALAAREMGGRLLAESAGAGAGAVFTLELPAQTV
ncbi:MAG TPA: ATP-binding protein [Verrucomicrobiae bacterium]|jgi:PAS domain S-box-containing protein|nr:ATP-binding protein [Verrucomicrobiae bacterium]